MVLLPLLIGSFLFVLGLGYLFKPQLVLRFNAFMRDRLLRDSYVLLENRKTGAILLLLSFIFLAMTLRSRH